MSQTNRLQRYFRDLSRQRLRAVHLDLPPIDDQGRPTFARTDGGGSGAEPELGGCGDVCDSNYGWDRDWREIAGIELLCVLLAVLCVGFCCGRLSAKWVPVAPVMQEVQR